MNRKPVAIKLIILLCSFGILGTTYYTCMKDYKQEMADNCFSKNNFEKVYKYIDSRITSSNSTFFKFDNYEIYLHGPAEIIFKKNEYTLAWANKEKGIVSLAKNNTDNKKIVTHINILFCKLFSLANQISENADGKIKKVGMLS